MSNQTLELTIDELESVSGGMDVMIGNIVANISSAGAASLLSTAVMAEIVKAASQVVKHLPQ